MRVLQRTAIRLLGGSLVTSLVGLGMHGYIPGTPVGYGALAVAGWAGVLSEVGVGICFIGALGAIVSGFLIADAKTECLGCRHRDRRIAALEESVVLLAEPRMGLEAVERPAAPVHEVERRGKLVPASVGRKKRGR